jgi:hypothetical protein
MQSFTESFVLFAHYPDMIDFRAFSLHSFRLLTAFGKQPPILDTTAELSESHLDQSESLIRRNKPYASGDTQNLHFQAFSL